MTSISRSYLDCNATHPLLPEAREAVVAALDLIGNPSSVHAEGRRARQIVDDARRSVAALLHGQAEHVTFTAGATEAANLLLTPAWQMGRAKLAIGALYVSATEHPCMLAGGQFSKEDIHILPVTGSGELALASLESALAGHDMSKGLPMVAIQHANNETGVVQPIKVIATIVKAHGGIMVVDAVQSVGRIVLDIQNSCGDFFILSSHKIGGPKGAGAIVGVTDLMMPVPLMRGGGQEKGRRPGTEAVPALAGFGAAAKSALARLHGSAELAHKRDRIEVSVLALLPNATIYGRNASERLPNTTFFNIPGMKAETAQIAFDLAGISLSAGSACSSGKVGPSHVLKAMGVETDEGAIRVSICLKTSDADIERFSLALRSIIARRQLDKMAAS